MIDENIGSETRGSRPDRYWATERDAKKLVGFCQDRIGEFRGVMKSSNFEARVMRSWRYYHNLFHEDADQDGDREIKLLGEDGEKVAASYNHYRSLLQSIITIATGDRPAVDCMATNTDVESVHQSMIAEDLCDYYLSHEGIESHYRRAIEHAIVLTGGFTVVEWDEMAGEAVDADPETGELIYEGEVDTWNPSVFDVIYDIHTQDWDRQRWVMVRKSVNRFELMEEYPAKKKVIREADPSGMSDIRTPSGGSSESDQVQIWKVFHMPTRAIPEGLEFSFLEDEPLGKPGPMRYRSMPVKRIMPAEYLLTPFGYTPGFDLQGPQEALNSEMSAILTNHRMGAVNRMWVDSNSDVDHRMITEDLALVQADTRPEALQLGQTIPDVFKMADTIRQEMEFFSGINSVFRGQPEASLKSGSALALIDAKAVQYNSILMAAAHKHLEEICQHLIEVLQDFPDPNYSRVYAISGKHKRAQVKHFTPGGIERIKRVQTRAVSPIMKTLSGRLELSTLLLQNNMIKTPEQLLTVIETGNIDPLTESETAQLSNIRQENSDLLEGEEVIASTLDDHVLHIREHSAVANSPDFRRDQERMANLHGHIMQHLGMVKDPGSQMIQVLLGYQAPMMGMGGGAPPPEPKGAPPGPNKQETPLPGIENPGDNYRGGASQPRMPQAPQRASI